jgi:ribonuclease D
MGERDSLKRSGVVEDVKMQPKHELAAKRNAPRRIFLKNKHIISPVHQQPKDSLADAFIYLYYHGTLEKVDI